MRLPPDPHSAYGTRPDASLSDSNKAIKLRANATPRGNNGTVRHDKLDAVFDTRRRVRGQQENIQASNDRTQGTKEPEYTQYDFSSLDENITESATEVVIAFLDGHDLVIRFDGNLDRSEENQTVSSIADVSPALKRPQYNFNNVLSRLILHSSENKLKLSSQVLNAALSVVIEEGQMNRKEEVLAPLYETLSPADAAEADRQWNKLVEVFHVPPNLAKAALKKFIFQVKRKSINLPIERHLMPIVQGRVQGGGKTSFVLKFLSPLAELQSGPTLFSDYIDRRSGDLYNYPVVFIDDVAQVRSEDLPTLNSIITGDFLQRRKLGTSHTIKIRQNSTLIGTCNVEFGELVMDETGNRRFFVLVFRNGAVTKGGDTEVWDTINATDYRLLWRSVDVFGEDPIAGELHALERWQSYHRHRSPLEQWVSELDIDSPDVKFLRDHHGIKVSDLLDLYSSQTKTRTTISKFGTELQRIIKNKVGPFAEKVRKENGVYCIIP